jgi:hypothetical protein
MAVLESSGIATAGIAGDAGPSDRFDLWLGIDSRVLCDVVSQVILSRRLINNEVKACHLTD